MPLGLTLIEAQKVARCAEQLAVLKTFAQGELLRRLPFRNLVGGSIVDRQGPEARAAQTEMQMRSMRLALEAGSPWGSSLSSPLV